MFESFINANENRCLAKRRECINDMFEVKNKTKIESA